MSATRGEAFSVVALLAGLVAAPAFSHFYTVRRDAQMVAAAPHSGKVHVYHLTGIAKPGMWTLDSVDGWNYWWKTPKKFKAMNVNLGDTVVVTLTSADVRHAFTIPAIGIGHIEVEPGKSRTISFVANKAGSFPFLCATVCSCTGTGFACTLVKKLGHEGMTGILTVTEPMGPPTAYANVTVSEEKGFDPPVIKVKQGDIVQLTVASKSNGTGSGVGFCITNYENKVDLQGIASGDSRTFKFRADTPGTFSIYSSTRAGDKIDAATGSFIVTAAPGQH